MEKNKRPYEPPVIGRIKIMVEESVMGPCKVFPGDTQGKVGTGQPTCGGNACKNVFGS